MNLTPAPPGAPAEGSPWLTTAEAADYLRCSQRQLRRYYLEGDLQHARRGQHVLFRIDWLDEHIEQKRPRATVRRRSA